MRTSPFLLVVAFLGCSSEPATPPDAAVDAALPDLPAPSDTAPGVDAPTPDVPAKTDAPSATDRGANLYAEAEDLVRNSCGMSGQCHSLGNRMLPQNLRLSEPGDLAAVVGRASREPPGNMPLVTAGDRMRSYLFRKLEGTQGTIAGCRVGLMANCGIQMPSGRTGPVPLSADEIEIVGRWISAGAPRP